MKKINKKIDPKTMKKEGFVSTKDICGNTYWYKPWPLLFKNEKTPNKEFKAYIMIETPMNNVRWFKEKNKRWILQAQWKSVSTGELTWKDVPFVEEKE